MLLLFLFYAPILFFAWALAFPVQAMSMVENLKLWQEEFINEYLINKDIHLLKKRFWKWGKLNGYKRRLIEAVLEKHAGKIVQRFESRYSQISVDELFQ